MIILIGTGHIFDISSNLLERFHEKSPDIVCVELDKDRYEILSTRSNNKKKYKKSREKIPILYKLFARYQNIMAKEYGVNPGDEMLTAIKYAKSNRIPFKLIDMNAKQLYVKTLESISISEKIKLSLTGVLLTLFGRNIIQKKQIDENLGRIKEEIDEYLDKFEKTFPTIKRLLIDERDEYMANKLVKLNEKYQKIVACIGDGHIAGISKLLKLNNIDHMIIRLGELQKKDIKTIET